MQNRNAERVYTAEDVTYSPSYLYKAPRDSHEDGTLTSLNNGWGGLSQEARG